MHPFKRFHTPTVVSFFALLLLAGFATAGSLTPPGAPASTMNTLEELFESIAGTFDSSTIVADQNGSLIEHLKYIEANMGTGGGVGSDSLDFDEFVDSMTLDANTSIASAGFELGIMSNVGIGTTNPAFALDVRGTTAQINVLSSTSSTNAQLVVGNSNSAGQGLMKIQNDTFQTLDVNVYGSTHTNVDSFGVGAGYVHMRAAVNTAGMIISTSGVGDPLILGTSQAERMRIDTNGNIGIGATTPDQKLEVAGNIFASASGNVDLILNSTGNQDGLWRLRATSTDGLQILGSASTAFMTVASSGNVGIGTVGPPAAPLHVRGANSGGNFDAAIFGNANSGVVGSAVTLYLTANNNAARSSALQSINTGGADNAQALAFLTSAGGASPAERMRITSTGNVGIASSSPGYRLAVEGSLFASSSFGSGLTDCDADSQTLSWNVSTGLFGCGDDDTGGSITSDSLDFDEFVDLMTLDANTTISNGGFALTLQNASVSNDFEVSGLASISGWHFASTITNTAGNGVPGAHFAYGDFRFPDVITAAKNAIRINVTSPATTATGQTRAFVVTQLSGTASSSASTTAILGDNKTPVYGNAGAGFAGAMARGVWGLYSGTATASTSVGGYFQNSGGGLNAYGGTGFCQAGTNCVGIAGISAGGTNRVGGYFGLDNGGGVGMPVITTAAAIFNNSTIAAPIVLFQDNGIEVMRVADGGNVGIASASPGYRLAVEGSLFASSSFGSGLTDCDTPATSKLLWNVSTGLFSCGMDQVGGGGGVSNLQIRELPGTYTAFPATASFNGNHFTLTASGSSDVTISLDWGAGGPASLSQDETVTGFWTFANNVSVSGTLETGGMVINGHLLPGAHDTYDLGSSTVRWRDLYLASGSLHIGTSGDEAVIDYNVNDDYLAFKPNGSTTRLALTDAGLLELNGPASISGNITTGIGSIINLASSGAGYQIDGSRVLSTKGTNNVWVGVFAGNAITTGTLNTAIGYTALLNNSTGDSNTANGAQALIFNVDGSYNTATGVEALATNTSGTNNTANGYRSLNLNSTGDSNTATGYYALNFSTGDFNTANGVEALNSTTGNSNTALGYQAGYNALGSGNVFLGRSAGFSETGSSTLWIENAVVASSSALIYGEFDTNYLSFGANVSVSGNFEVGGTLIANAVSFSSVSGNLEITGYASASQYFGGGLTDCDADGQTVSWDAATGRFGCGDDDTGGGGSVASDSLDFDEFVDAMTLDANTSIANAGFVLTLEQASVSGNFEVAGYASASRLFGAGLTDCDTAASSKLLWDVTTGRFSCGSDQQGAGAAGGWTDDGTVVRLSASTDNVGIGTATIDSGIKFEVVGVASVSSNIIINNTVGNVGIGTSAPAARLTVTGGAGSTADLARLTSSSGTIVFQVNNDGFAKLSGPVTIGGGAITVADLFNQINTDTTNFNQSRTEIAATDDLFIDGDLEVDGILDIGGAASVGSNFEAAGNVIKVLSTADNVITDPNFTFASDPDTGISNDPSNAANKLFFVTGGVANMVLDAQGELLLGNSLTTLSDATAKLHVIGTAGANEIARFTSVSGAFGLVIGPNRALTMGGGAYVAADDFHQFNTDATNENPSRTEIGALDDLFISGDLEVDGIADFLSTASVGGNLEVAGNVIKVTSTADSVITDPNFTFAGDPDTGISNEPINAVNKLYFVTGGFSNMVLDAEGDLLLGNSLTVGSVGSAKLHVIGTAGANEIVRFASVSGANGLVIGPNRAMTMGGAAYTAADDFHQFNTDATNNNPERAEIADLTDLYIAGDLEAEGILDIGGNASFSANLEMSTNGTRLILPDLIGIGDVTTPILTFNNDRDTGISHEGTNAANKLYFTTAGVSNVLIDAEGDLLLGNSLAFGSLGAAKLDVFGTSGANNIAAFASSSLARALIIGPNRALTIGGAAYVAADDFHQINDDATSNNPGRSEISTVLDLYVRGDVEIDGILDVAGAVSISGSFEPSGVILAANGTAAAPSYSFSSDTNMGMYRSAADTLGFSTSGIERLNINDSGASLSGTLEVTGAVKTGDGTAALPAYSFSGDPNTGVYRIGTDILGFSTAGAEAMRINAAGSVAINAGVLQVSGTTFVAYNRLGTGTTGNGLNANDDLLISDDLEVDGTIFADGGIDLNGADIVDVDNITANSFTGGTFSGTSFTGGTFSGSSMSVSGTIAGGGASFSGNIEVAGVAKLSAGSAGAPGYTFTGATSTGIYRSGTTLGFSAAGTGATLTSAGLFNAAGGFADAGTPGQDSDCATNEFLGNMTVSGGIVTAGSCETDDVDYAERFYAGEAGIGPGDLVVADPRGSIDIGVPSAEFNQAVRKSTAPYQESIVGIISTHPGLVIGAKGTPEHPAVEVALAGRVPVKVTGTVAVGDRLSASGIPGVAQKATKAGMTVGLALTEPYMVDSDRVVMAFVDPGYWMPGVEDIAQEEEQEESGLFATIVGFFRDLLGIEFGTGGRIKATELCLDDVCVTKDELRELLEQGSGSAPAPEEDEPVEDEPADDEEAPPAQDPEPAEDEPETEPEPAPEPEDEPAEEEPAPEEPETPQSPEQTEG